MNKNEESIKIGFDYKRQSIELKQLGSKNRIWKDIDAFFTKYDLILKEGVTDFEADFKRLFKEEHGQVFPVFVPLDSILKLSNVDLELLASLENQHNRLPIINPDEDYTIYANTPRQIESYKLANKLLDLVKEHETFYGKMHEKLYTELSICFRGLITVDPRTSTRSINVNRIKNVT